ncbi:MAG: hypothetical protein COA78_07995 [Blastopirellula sp.]|nr:MAG: hypothetical protein COA78_07995 [Blastopirellula sp.]
MNIRKKSLRKQRKGMVQAAGLIFFLTIVVMGSIVGLVQVRNHLIQEYGDTAVGLDHLDQSFSYTINVNGEICEAEYVDQNIYNKDNMPLEDPGPKQAPAWLELDIDPTSEGNL